MRDGVVDPYFLALKAIEIASLASKFGEVVAGTHREKTLLELLRALLETHADNIVLESVPVLSWVEENCIVECNGFEDLCALQPPMVGHIDIEVRKQDLRILDPDEVLKEDIAKLSVEEKIVVLNIPQDPDDILLLTLKLCKGNPKAIIFVDKYPYRRRIPILAELIPKYGVSKAINVPVIQVPSYLGPTITSKNCVVRARSKIIESTGFNTIAEIYNGGENFIYVTAHHDHWFTGFSDNLLGIGLAYEVLELFEKYKGIGRYNIRFVSFTAEEGFPIPLSPLYWIVGSRIHVLKNSDFIAENLLAVVNYDVVLRGRIKVACSDPGIQKILAELGMQPKDIEFDQIIFDSFSFSSLGIPALTFHTFDSVLNLGIYHSDGDTKRWVDVNALVQAIDLTYRLLKAITDPHKLKKEYIRGLTDIINDVLRRQVMPLELLIELYRASRVIERENINSWWRIARVINRLFVSCYVTPEFFSELGVREETSFAPWREGIVELPLGLRYEKSIVLEKYASIRESLNILTLASIVQNIR